MNDIAEPKTLAQRAEDARDLKRQLAELGDYDEQEVIFRETSPQRRTVPLWSMETGERHEVYRYRVNQYLDKRLPNGKDMFTGYEHLAPKYVGGQTKCFMAATSMAREVLNSIGIHKVCVAEHLQNEFTAEQHALHKHKAEWRTYQAYINKKEQDEWRAQQRAQTEAMMAMAGRAVAPSEPIPVASAEQDLTCHFPVEDGECGQVCASLAGLRAHERSHEAT